MPFERGLGALLSHAIQPRALAAPFPLLRTGYWAPQLKLWPYDVEGELDVLIEFEQLIIGIEVKLFSSLSSDDDIHNVDDVLEKSKNQLARESRILAKMAPTKQKLLLLLAPRSACLAIFEDVQVRRIIEPSVHFGYVSWQDFLHHATQLQPKLADYEALIIRDIIELLTRKGFEDFNTMHVDAQPVIREAYFTFKGETITTQAFQFKQTQPIQKEAFYAFK